MVKTRDIIILNGPPKVGKDFIFSTLEKELRVMKIALAGPVAMANFHAFGLADLGRKIRHFEKNKNVPKKVLNGLTWRETKIRTAETFNAMYGWDFWAKIGCRIINEIDEELKIKKSKAIKMVTDLCFPEQIKIFEENYADRAILVRVHRHDLNFGKYLEFEHDYGEGTGEDSRNWVFSNILPSFDFVNNSDSNITMLSDFINTIKHDVNYIKYALQRNDKTLLVLGMAKPGEFIVPQNIQMTPFMGQHLYPKWVQELISGKK